MRASFEQKLFTVVRVGEELKVKKTPIIIDHTMSMAVPCAAAKTKGLQHRIEFGFQKDGTLAYAVCDCLRVSPAVKVMNTTIEALGGELCIAALRAELKKFKVSVSARDALTNFDGWYGLRGPTVRACVKRSQVRDNHGAAKQFNQPTKQEKWEALISKQATAKTGVKLLVEAYDHSTGFCTLKMGYVNVVTRRARGQKFTTVNYISTESKHWMENTRCRCCKAEYHGAYVNRHLQTSMHKKVAAAALTNVCAKLNKTSEED